MTYILGANIAAADYSGIVGSQTAFAANVLPSWSDKGIGLNVYGDNVTRCNNGSTFGWSSVKSSAPLARAVASLAWYWEVTIVSANKSVPNNNIIIGVGVASSNVSNFVGFDNQSVGLSNSGGNTQRYWTNNTSNAYGTGTFGEGDVIGVYAYLGTPGQLTVRFYKNGVAGLDISLAQAMTAIYPMVSLYDRNNSVSINLGERDFVYPIPSGAIPAAPASLNTLGPIWGVGYGDWGYNQSSPAISLPTAGSNIVGSAWATLNTIIEKCTSHQGISTALTPPANVFDVADLITAHTAPSGSTAYSFARSIGALGKNRHAPVVGAMTVYLPTTYGLRLTYSGASWGSGATNGLKCTARYAFTNEEDARKFFNTGGEFRISLVHPNTSTVQNTSWNTICSSIGTVKFGANSCIETGDLGHGTGDGYYQLTTTAKEIFRGNNIGAGAYSSNDVLITARSINAPGSNGGKGYQIEISISLIDQHTNAFSDVVNNGTYADFGYYAASTYLTSPVPTVTQVFAWATISG